MSDHPLYLRRVRLTCGLLGTILEVWDDGAAFSFEPDGATGIDDLMTITPDDLAKRMREGAVKPAHEVFSEEFIAAFAATLYEAGEAADRGDTINFGGDYAASLAFIRSAPIAAKDDGRNK